MTTTYHATSDPPQPGDGLDVPTRALVRFSAAITTASGEAVREALRDCARSRVPNAWIEELILQSYLFSGFPRTLNAAREWRRQLAEAGVAPQSPPATAPEGQGDWRTRGEATCAIVYGANYQKLRTNVRELHPALDDWMVVEGYGKVLSRPGLDLLRRELCIVSACAVSGQDRQLLSHLKGALHAGASPGHLDSTLELLRDFCPRGTLSRARLLWKKVRPSAA